MSSDLALEPEAKGYIGQRYDSDAGLQYLNARYYDPDLSLFTQSDWWHPLRSGVGANRYSYSFNDPVNLSDPSGNSAIDANGTVYGDNGEPIGHGDPNLTPLGNTDDLVESWGGNGDGGNSVNVASLGGFVGHVNFTNGTGGVNGIGYFPTNLTGVNSYTCFGVCQGNPSADIGLPPTNRNMVINGTVVIAGTTYSNRNRTYVTYVLTNKKNNFRKYYGRTSGFGSPQQLADARYARHTRKLTHHGPRVDKAIQGNGSIYARGSAYGAIRGREDQLIRVHGGPNTAYVDNSVNGIGTHSRFRPGLNALSDLYFGPLTSRIY